MSYEDRRKLDDAAKAILKEVAKKAAKAAAQWALKETE